MPRFSPDDFDLIAEYILDEFSRRKNRRAGMEAYWDDVDRQIRMTSTRKHKMIRDAPDRTLAWRAELELPLQAQTLEVLTADARRMMFSDDSTWFSAHADVTGDIEAVERDTGLPVSDLQRSGQRDSNKRIEGLLNHFHRQYDFFGNYDQINAEAFKYGIGVGRGRLVTKQVLIETAKGIERDKARFPVIVPRAIRNVYLDDTPHNVMSEGISIGPAIVAYSRPLLEDVKISANRGSNDPKDENGGWMPAAVNKLVPDKNQCVELLEFEGDLVVPRREKGSIFQPGVIVTVAKGGVENDRATRAVVRWRFRKYPFSSYVLHPYQNEDLSTPYPSSPLLKGRPVQMAATEALNNLIDCANLRTLPPIGYDRNDPEFVSKGGPLIHPRAQWGSTEDIKVHEIGDPAALLQMYISLLQQYADVTGVNQPRLGAQTVSHTTAFAKEREEIRGTARTVDYVTSTGKGPLSKWLYMEYEMGRDAFGERTIYLDGEKRFERLSGKNFPRRVGFEWFGAGGPTEERTRREMRLQSAQMAIQMDTLNVQMGGRPVLDLAALVEQTLKEGGWVDVDAVTRSAGLSGGPQGSPALAGPAGADRGPESPPLQTIQGGIT